MVKKVIFHPKLLVCHYTVLHDFLGPVSDILLFLGYSDCQASVSVYSPSVTKLHMLSILQLACKEEENNL